MSRGVPVEVISLSTWNLFIFNFCGTDAPEVECQNSYYYWTVEKNSETEENQIRRRLRPRAS